MWFFFSKPVYVRPGSPVWKVSRAISVTVQVFVILVLLLVAFHALAALLTGH